MPSLMDMFQPQDIAGQPTDFGGALRGNSNAMVGMGMGLLQPWRPGESPYGAALQGFQAGSVADQRRGVQQAQLAHQKRQEAFQRSQAAQSQSNWERQFARSDPAKTLTDAQRAYRDIYGVPGSPDYKGTPETQQEFFKQFYLPKIEGEWETKDIIDPSDPDGERKVTVQQNKRTGQYRRPDLSGTAAPVDPFTAGGGQPVFGAGEGGFSATPGTAAAAPAAPRQHSITLPNGEVVTPPPGLNKDGRKAWANHVATTAAKMQAGEMTEGQAKYSIYATGMEIAQQELKALEGQGTSQWGKGMAAVPWGVGNWFQSKEYQAFRTAKDAWLNAKLRAESGATINPDEFARDERIFFPQPGDGPQQIMDKARLREHITQKMTKAGGPGYQPPPGIATTPGPTTPGPTTAAPAGKGTPPPPPGFTIVAP